MVCVGSWKEIWNLGLMKLVQENWKWYETGNGMKLEMLKLSLETVEEQLHPFNKSDLDFSLLSL